MPVYEREQERFRALNAQVVGVSADSPYANAAWAQYQLGGISYPLLSDFFPHGAVMQAYGVMRPSGSAQRALFIVDAGGIVRFIDVHETRDVPDVSVLLSELEKLPA